MQKKNVYVFFCFVTGLIACLVKHDFFTSDSLVESLLLLISPLFFMLKYIGSSIIKKYDDPAYVPSGEERLKDNFWKVISINIGQPVCISFLYACTFLLLIKWLFPSGSDGPANLIYKLNRLNEEHLQGVVLFFLSVMVIMTILEIVSARFSIKAGKLTDKVTYPLKVVAIMALFVHADTGISNKAIAWKMNNQTIETETRVTFNNSKGQRDTIRQIRDLYIDIIVTRSFSAQNRIADTPVVVSEDDFYRDMHQLKTWRRARACSFIWQDMNSLNVGGPQIIPIDSSRAAFDRFFSIDSTFRKNHITTGELYSGQYNNAAFTSAHQKLDDILSILNDERRSIKAPDNNIEQSLYRDVLKSWLGQLFGLTGIENHIGMVTFVNETMKDFLNEKMADGLFYLFKKDKIKRADIEEAEIFGTEIISETMPQAMKKLSFHTRSLDAFNNYFNLAYLNYDSDYDFAKRYQTIGYLTKLFADFPDCKAYALKRKFKLWLENHTDDEINNTFTDERLETFLLDANELLKKTGPGPTAGTGQFSDPRPLPVPPGIKSLGPMLKPPAPTFWVIPTGPAVDRAHAY